MLNPLRTYQVNAINSVREALQSGLKRIILQAPCGAGKTLMAASIVSSAKAKNKRVAFVVNRIGLVKQTSKVFNNSYITHGIIQGSNTRFAGSNIVVCSIATLARRGYPQDLDLLIIDESHACTSDSYTNLIKAYKDIPIIGLTATAYTRGLGRVFEWGKLFEKIVSAATISELTEQGFLVPFDVYAPDSPDLRNVKINRFGDYDEQQLGDVVDRPKLVGSIVENWKRLALGKSTVVFATNIAHSLHIAEEFVAAGISCEHIDCHTSEEDKAAILGRHSDGTTTVVTNVGILCEGHDNPRIEVMVLARPTRSLVRFIQMAGRALRPYPGKDRSLIIDHSGTVFLLGFPDEEHPLELDDGKKKEYDLESKVTEERLPRECPACHYVIPPGFGACPKCGATVAKKNKVKHEDGELKKLERQELSHADKQELWSSALGVRDARNEKRVAKGKTLLTEAWAANLYKSITHSWPSGLENKSCVPLESVVKRATANDIKFLHRRK